jgi:hypothetical protein
MFKKLVDTDEFSIHTKGIDGLKSITTIDGKFEVHNPTREMVADFEQETGFNTCKIDDINQPDLSRFVQDGTSYNGVVDFDEQMDNYYVGGKVPERVIDLVRSNLPTGKSLHHIDMSKAYANFHMCKYYTGFLGKITDFRQTDKIEGVGMYRITNLFIPSGKLYDLNEKLQCYFDDNVYPSPELEMLRDNGCTFDIVAGCWGVQTIDFRFPDEMMESKHYAKWVGTCNSIKHERQFWIKGDAHYLSILNQNLPDGHFKTFNQYNSETREGLYQYKMNTCNHLSQVTAFILSYMRMNVIEQLYEFDISNVIRVHTDGIYHTQESVTTRNCFRVKEADSDMNMQTPPSGEFCYCSAYIPLFKSMHKRNPVLALPRAHNKTELHLGSGGCGKTHYNLADKGLIRVLFVAPSWKLARTKERETGHKCTVWARVISDDPDKVGLIKRTANVLVIDEVSMMTEHEKLKIMAVYSNMKIIFCGDLGYQLPAVVGEPFTPAGIEYTQKHTTNYRTQDPELLKLLNGIRELIDREAPLRIINAHVMECLKERVISFAELQTKYGVNDMILSGTNEVKDLYTNAFKGKFAQEKWYITENSTLNSNGEIVVSATKPKTKCEERHCFTVHSIQGETAECNLYVDCSRMFDPCMFYTALSRARRIDQIYIVKNEQVKNCKYNQAKVYAIETKTQMYIGSTVQPLEVRSAQHLRESAAYYTSGKNKFCTSYPLFQEGGAKIRLLEKMQCDDLAVLQEREAEIIRANPSCVNKTFKQ